MGGEELMERFAKHQEKLKLCHGWIEIGPGWFDLVDRLLTDLPEGVQVSQIKEKFGTLRCYVYHWQSEEVYARIRQAENESAKTCEVCGEPGELTGKKWFRVRCAACE